MVFDKEYFEGDLIGRTLPWGYSYYERWYRYDGVSSKGEYWKDKAQYLYQRLELLDKTVLDIGCAKGFLVSDLRDQNVNIWGIDISEYAISQVEIGVKKYIACLDALSYLEEIDKQRIDVIVSLRFLSCLQDKEYIKRLIYHMNRVSKQQYHVIDETLSDKFYIQQSTEKWLQYDWKKGTILVSHETGKETKKR